MSFISMLLATFQLSFSLCLNPSLPFSEDNLIASDEYAVYSVLIQHRYVKEGTKIIVVSNQTQFYKVDWERPEDYRKSILRELKPISEETIEDFEKKNEKRGELTRHLDLTINYVLLGEQSKPTTPEDYQSQWKRFYEKYPTSPGIVSLSRVGFNSGNDEAVVYVAQSCEGLCGRGSYVLLIRDEMGWKVKSEMLLWVS